MYPTGTTCIKVKEFDNFFVTNYTYLLGFTKSIDVRNDYENLLHDVYIKLRNRITLSGYSGTTYLNFTRVTIMNTYKTLYRDKKRTIEYGSNDHSDEIENQLQQEYDYQEQHNTNDMRMSYINTSIYEYVDRYFTPKENAIFKTYYCLKHKRLNYKQLSKATGYSITSVSNTINRMKKNIRENLKTYILTGMNNEELQAMLKEVEEVLKLPIGTYSTKYKELYRKIYNKNWTGCNCQIIRLRETLKQWYDSNKSIIA